MQFGREQEQALSAVGDWLKDPSEQLFRLFGFAGTGKTTLARYLSQDVSGRVIFSAFTGKATYVLKQKGCPNATTIHKLIYLPKDKSKRRLIELEADLQVAQAEGDLVLVKELSEAIRLEKKNLERPMFQLNFESELAGAKLLVVDECSMVDERMAEDLLSFDTKILVLGDPAQLPPVKGTGYFTDADPDFMLTEIHRQAKGDPIIDLATKIRKGQLPDYGTYGDSRVIHPAEFKRLDLAMEADQILVGKNDTRKAFNRRMRERLGFEGELPVEGDRLVCLKNNHENGLLNGSIWTVEDSHEDEDFEDRLNLVLKTEDGEGQIATDAHSHHFIGKELPYWDRKEADEFDYGYALTCHKSQGSQWDRVAVWDESAVFRQDRWRWLYTAVTRAAKQVDLVVRDA